MVAAAGKARRQVNAATWITALAPCTAIDGVALGRAWGMNRRTVIFCCLLLAGCQSDARMRWDRIGPGPTLEYAEAQCNIMAMGVGQNTVAIGSPSFVAGAALGDAIATGIAQQQFKKNCMVMQGWKQVPDVRGPAPTSATATKSDLLEQFGEASNQCAVNNDKAACGKRDALEIKLKRMGAYI